MITRSNALHDGFQLWKVCTLWFMRSSFCQRQKAQGGLCDRKPHCGNLSVFKHRVWKNFLELLEYSLVLRLLLSPYLSYEARCQIAQLSQGPFGTCPAQLYPGSMACSFLWPPLAFTLPFVDLSACTSSVRGELQGHWQAWFPVTGHFCFQGSLTCLFEE